jgi:integrase
MNSHAGTRIARADEPRDPFHFKSPHYRFESYRPYRMSLLTLARAGLRPGEAYALEPRNLDFRSRQIVVERALSVGPRAVRGAELAGARAGGQASGEEKIALQHNLGLRGRPS